MEPARRTVIRFNYRYHRGYNNSDGAFSVPPTGSLADQWAPVSGDTQHRVRASISTQALRNLSAQVSYDANTGAPYTITTGFDDNGDSIFNDRPLLTLRNSVRHDLALLPAGDVGGQPAAGRLFRALRFLMRSRRHLRQPHPNRAAELAATRPRVCSRG